LTHIMRDSHCFGFRLYEAIALEDCRYLDEILSRLRAHGFHVTSKGLAYNSHFNVKNGEFFNVKNEEFEDLMACFCKGRINLIILFHPEIFMRYRIATQMAKAKNITNKSERIKFFNAIVAGNTEVERVVFGKNPGWRNNILPF